MSGYPVYLVWNNWRKPLVQKGTGLQRPRSSTPLHVIVCGNQVAPLICWPHEITFSISPISSCAEVTRLVQMSIIGCQHFYK